MSSHKIPKNLGIVGEGKEILHRYYVIPFEMRGDVSESAHVFKGQTCWCKPTVRTNWNRYEDGSPHIIVSHEGA